MKTKMQTIVNSLRLGRMKGWGLLAAVVAVSSLCVASMSQGQYRFGGGWIGTDGAGTVWSVLQIPLDPAGRTAAIRVNNLAVAGGTPNTEAIGEGEMISRDTAKWSLMTYVQTQDDPPQISQIWVLVGTLKFTGPNSLELNYTLSIYLAGADANGDGFPDPGTSPIATVPDLTGSAKRVPIP